ncbi:unnamed protein product [Prunus armeniaca]|uniref:Uncharacterized protein n=1 Tax=Prunus armeniaca TaxID=36596 RepID=A0A6J5YDY6_PRUAR|nr:unnamed protein product [Prunus armeniaca]
MEIVEEVLDMSEESVPSTVDVENLSEEASVKSVEVRGNIKSHHQPPTASAVVGNREENASFASKFVSKLTKFFKHKGWVEESQGTLLLLSSVIAIFCFQNLLNPPRGLRQQTTTNVDDGDYSTERPCFDGIALLGNSHWWALQFVLYLMLQLCVHILKFSLSLPVIKREATHANDKYLFSDCWTMEIVEEVLDMNEESVPITVDVENLSEEASIKSVEVRGNIKSHHQPPTASAVVGNREENASFASKFVSKLTKFFKHKGWVEESQGTLLLLSSVIAIFCFQNLLNPPRGLRQQMLMMETTPQEDHVLLESHCLAIPTGQAISTPTLALDSLQSIAYSYSSY